MSMLYCLFNFLLLPLPVEIAGRWRHAAVLVFAVMAASTRLPFPTGGHLKRIECSRIQLLKVCAVLRCPQLCNESNTSSDKF
jgi:hypothetical protein